MSAAMAMDSAEVLVSPPTTGPPSVKRHRRKLSKDPPKNYYNKKRDRPRAASTPDASAPAPPTAPGPTEYRRSWWSRRGKASVDLGRAQQQKQQPQLHIGPPPRGDADTYSGTDDDDVTKWSKDVLFGLSGVRARTPNKEELPVLEEGKHDSFVLASDRLSAIPSAWARQQLEASLSRGDGILRVKESDEEKQRPALENMSDSRKEGLSETFHKLEEDGEDAKIPQASNTNAGETVGEEPQNGSNGQFGYFVTCFVKHPPADEKREQPDKLAETTPSYLAEASGVIDDIYAPENGDISDKDVKREVALIGEHQSPAPEDHTSVIPTKILPAQHEMTVPDTTITDDYERNPHFYSQEVEQSSHHRERPVSNGKTTIVLRYSKGPSENGQDKRSSSATASSTSTRKSTSPGHLGIPQERIRQDFLADPSPIDPSVRAEAISSERYEASSPETPTIATFGIAGGSPGQESLPLHEGDNDATIPRSVPEPNLPVPVEKNTEETAEENSSRNREEVPEVNEILPDPELKEDEVETSPPTRPEIHTMDTATTIDVDRRVPGSIF